MGCIHRRGDAGQYSFSSATRWTASSQPLVDSQSLSWIRYQLPGFILCVTKTSMEPRWSRVGYTRTQVVSCTNRPANSWSIPLQVVGGVRQSQDTMIEMLTNMMKHLDRLNPTVPCPLHIVEFNNVRLQLNHGERILLQRSLWCARLSCCSHQEKIWLFEILHWLPQMNAVTRKDAYPLLEWMMSWMPWLPANGSPPCIYSVATGKWRLTLEIVKRQLLLPMMAYLNLLKMPFSLCNAPATFQRLMDLVLAGL